MTEAHDVIVDEIVALIKRRGATPPEITSDSTLAGDCGLDSLDLAELSAALEDRLGKDPYSQGVVPATYGELLAFYQ